MKRLIYILLCLSFTSCAIVSKKDCAELDWSSRAQQDIQANRSWQKYLEKYNKVCTKHGISMSEDYMSGVHAKGGKICTRFESFPEQGWSGLGVRDALGPYHPKPGQYSESCLKYNIGVDLEKYNEGVKSVGGRACSNFSDFEEKGWTGVGKRDATSGRASSVDSYVKTCKENYFTEVNTKDFKAGYKAGLVLFCKKKSGYEFGLAGGSYSKTCTRNERSFLSGYQIGSDVRKANSLEGNLKSAISRGEQITKDIAGWHRKIETLNSDLKSSLWSYNSRKDSIESDIETQTRRLGSEGSPEEQDSIRTKLSELREDAAELEEKMLQTERNTTSSVEEARFTISKLREERRQIDRKVPSLEAKYRAARAKADKGLKRL